MNRTQSKFSENRKSGGRRTLKECERCGKIVRTRWKFEDDKYCYSCYKELNKMKKNKRI